MPGWCPRRGMSFAANHLVTVLTEVPTSAAIASTVMASST